MTRHHVGYYMPRYHVEYYSEATGDMICWYSTGNKDEAERQASHTLEGLRVVVKELRNAQH
jgi:hypothetical protein